MPGAFEASPEFDHDELRTAEEIQRCGAEVLAWLAILATGASLRPVDSALIDEIHRRWFETTFPADAGRHRRATVLNRKATAVPYEAILPAVWSACDNWSWRREHAAPGHLRNYLLMLDGLRPLVELRDEAAYLDAWWAASPHDHEALDEVVLRELAWQDR